MITRLKVTGFKNLDALEVQLGPVTGIAGLNGVGKSNLLDALRLLKLLASVPVAEAFSLVRGGDQDPINLFTRGGDLKMSFDLDFLISKSGSDAFGQPTNANSTFLNYRLALTAHPLFDWIRVESEDLVPIRKAEAAKKLTFAQKAWLDSVVISTRSHSPLISTDAASEEVKLYRETSQKTFLPFKLQPLGRTILSGAHNGQENPTLVLARQALSRMRFLLLEPSAIRKPDSFHSRAELEEDGSNLAATLNFLSQDNPELFFASLSNRLATLVEGVAKVSVERDEARKTLVAYVEFYNGQRFPASSLSDGTLRFLALAALEMDNRTFGTFCLEEPENGIHPERLESILKLLRAYACDPTYPSAPDNPLRQVVFTTHSAQLVERLRPEELLFAYNHYDLGILPQGLDLMPVRGTWRSGKPADLGRILSYLQGQPLLEEAELTPTMHSWVQGELDWNS